MLRQSQTSAHRCEQCGAAYYALGLCMRCYSAKRRREDPEPSRLAHGRYRATHREEINASARRWYQEHREEKLTAVKAYKDAHREEINAAQRARKRGVARDAIAVPMVPRHVVALGTTCRSTV